ncbi:capsid vertex protein [Salmonella phage vB_SenM-AKM_NP4]|uniref:Capsid vertex protein n=4 Tax=Gelderlandvirus TaxID=1913653 RepID=M1EAQ7_BPS16|nr:head vertex protein [Salmonella phage vB_SenM-S16]YP_009126372.1 head vertex protein [Salmonella phage STP4-a]YP_009148157.1 capsid vertex [Salmonella phage STML-198]YP_009615652.1 capsid vertex protein [Salmonella phage Melville]UFK27035.1 hypothetical protein LG358_00014 [Escherichia phage UoN_LG358_1]UPW42537.1 capsid vertex protein [Salmonella phage CF-SP2]WDR21831.1 capsid vertex protein [Salmonella phage vB_SenM_UTK0003]WLI71792.1 capsid vertex protein [Salmonella phage vB_SenM-AKM_
MQKIDNLIRESTVSSANSLGRPNLLSYTKATNKRIFKSLVAEQKTNQPIAALYGIRVLNPVDKMTYLGGATYAGQIGLSERESLPLASTPSQSFNKGEMFLFEDVVFKALEDNPFAGTAETDMREVISEAIAAGHIRMVSDAANTNKFENGHPEIAEAGFRIDKWQTEVKSRKLKTSITVELAQDLESNGFDAPNFIEDVLAVQMAEEINKDVLQSLITVSSRFKVQGISEKGVLNLTDPKYDNAQDRARTLYYYMCEMNSAVQRQTSFSGTYAVASSRCAAILAASGWVEKSEDQDELAYGVLKNGLPLYADVNSPCDYVIVGVNADLGEGQTVASLYYAPYVEGLDDVDEEGDTSVGEFKVIVDPDSLQPTIALLARYALTANPYTVAKDEKEARVIDGADMDKMANQSQLSSYLGVKLPPLEK